MGFPVQGRHYSTLGPQRPSVLRAKYVSSPLPLLLRDTLNYEGDSDSSADLLISDLISLNHP